MPQWKIGTSKYVCLEAWYLRDCVGLYTSPHLVAVRERIRINGKPIAEEDFARYFFEVWDRLEKNDVVSLNRTFTLRMTFKLL